MLTVSQQTCEGWTLDACEAAIREAFAGTCGRMDIRRLWSRDQTHNFRVNWWRLKSDSTEHHIDRSEFVTVDVVDGAAVMRRPLAKSA
jgi:hypothetical protein